jgi:hypothetical protein
MQSVALRACLRTITLPYVFAIPIADFLMARCVPIDAWFLCDVSVRGARTLQSQQLIHRHSRMPLSGIQSGFTKLFFAQKNVGGGLLLAQNQFHTYPDLVIPACSRVRALAHHHLAIRIAYLFDGKGQIKLWVFASFRCVGRVACHSSNSAHPTLLALLLSSTSMSTGATEFDQ